MEVFGLCAVGLMLKNKDDRILFRGFSLIERQTTTPVPLMEKCSENTSSLGFTIIKRLTVKLKLSSQGSRLNLHQCIIVLFTV